MMPKRILIFSLTYFPFVGGAEVAVREITSRIRPADYEFDMITLRFDSELPEVERDQNITVYRIGKTIESPSMSDLYHNVILKSQKYFFRFAAHSKARALQKIKPYDGIWSIMASYAGFAAAAFKMKYKKIP